MPPKGQSTSTAGSVISAPAKRETTRNVHDSRDLFLTDDDLDVITEALTLASRSVRIALADLESTIARLSHTQLAEYLAKWAERFDDLHERIEQR